MIEHGMKRTAGQLMHSIICIDPKATVAKAAQAMKKSNIGSIFVGDKEKPLGIFTERDVTRRVIADGLDPKKTKVSDVMTKKLVTADASESLDKVFDCLAEGQFRHLPITENGKIVGIVSLTDLARVFRELYQDDQFLESFSDKIKS